MRKRKNSGAAHKRRGELLGMPIGKASHKLRKAIMFDMATKLGLLDCFRCQEPIKIDEFTIEHKDAWERAADPVLAFFSMENIAFSHFDCNVRAKTSFRKYATAEEAKRAKAAQHRSQKYLEKKKLWKQKRRAEQQRLGLKTYNQKLIQSSSD